jgi:ENTS family enterobactin (siderophore) exporter
VFLAMLISAAGLVGAGAMGSVIVAVLGLLAHGFGEAVADILRFATVQKYTPDDYHGRIAGVWTAQVTAGASVGAFVAGVVAAVVPVHLALTVYGATGLVATVLLWAILPTLRRLDESRTPTPVA